MRRIEFVLGVAKHALVVKHLVLYMADNWFFPTAHCITKVVRLALLCQFASFMAVFLFSSLGALGKMRSIESLGFFCIHVPCLV